MSIEIPLSEIRISSESIPQILFKVVNNQGILGTYIETLYTTINNSDSLPDQDGNSGKFLTTDGTIANWASIPGGGDMLVSVYDPTYVSGDAFSMDSMVEGSTTKIFTNEERTKLIDLDNAFDALEMTALPDSIATSIVVLRNNFNALLANLRSVGLLAT